MPAYRMLLHTRGICRASNFVQAGHMNSTGLGSSSWIGSQTEPVHPCGFPNWRNPPCHSGGQRIHCDHSTASGRM